VLQTEHYVGMIPISKLAKTLHLLKGCYTTE